jgi:hypothetical protein
MNKSEKALTDSSYSKTTTNVQSYHLSFPKCDEDNYVVDLQYMHMEEVLFSQRLTECIHVRHTKPLTFNPNRAIKLKIIMDSFN